MSSRAMSDESMPRLPATHFCYQIRRCQWLWLWRYWAHHSHMRLALIKHCVAARTAESSSLQPQDPTSCGSWQLLGRHHHLGKR